MTFSSVVYSYQSDSEKPYQLDAYRSRNGEVTLDVNAEFKTYKGLKDRLEEVLKELQKQEGR